MSEELSNTTADDAATVPGDSAAAEAAEAETQEPPPSGEEAPAEPTPEELAAQEEAKHVHFLSTYTPVLTRLPDALGTAPEQEYVPADAPEENDGA